MKLSIDMKNKKGSLDSDVEKLVEKSMDLHEKDWKDKFSTKHIAKKELLELQHKQKIEIEEQNKTKKNWIQKIIEENRKTKKLELEDRRIREEAERIEAKKIIKIKIIFTIILGILAIVFFTIGSLLGYASRDPNSGWYALSVLGIIIGLAISFIWLPGNESKKKK